MIYIINQYSTFTSYGRCLFASTDREKAWKEYLDWVHETACNQYDEDVPEYFLSKEYNTVGELNHINQWEELAEQNREFNYYDSSDDSYMRVTFIEWSD